MCTVYSCTSRQEGEQSSGERELGECPFTTLHSIAVEAVVSNKQTRQQLGEQTHDLQELCLYFVGNTLVKTQTPNKNSFRSSKNDLQIDVCRFRVRQSIDYFAVHAVRRHTLDKQRRECAMTKPYV